MWGFYQKLKEHKQYHVTNNVVHSSRRVGGILTYFPLHTIN